MLRMSGNYLVFALWAFLLCLLGCQPAQLKNPEQKGLQNASTQTTLLNLPNYPALEKTQTEGQVHISGQTVKLELKLPTADPAFKTQLLDLALAGKITASVKDSYGKIYYPVGADASHQVDYPVSGVLSLTFNNVVPDPLLFVKVQVLDTSPADIVQAELAAVLRHTGINNASTTLNFYTTALAKTLETLLGTNATRARSLNLSTLDTLMTSVTGRSGSIPNYTYIRHPSLVKTAQLASDLVSNEPGTLTAATYRGVGGIANLTVSGLLGSDKLQVQITDAASVVKTNLGNGAHSIAGITPSGLVKVKASPFGTQSALYTYTISPNSVNLSEAGNQPLLITATPSLGVTSFSSASGFLGDNITLNGVGFTGATSVLFNGVNASFSVISDTQIMATIPPSATDGSITVTTPAGTATSSSFDVQRMWFVKETGTASDNGLSWASATDLQTALNSKAQAGDEIWVAAGTYKPVNPAIVSAPTVAERNLSFNLKTNVKVYGGFAGTESTLAERTASLTDFVTYLSGDLDGNDDYSGAAPGANLDNNSRTVVICSNNSFLDGVTIRGGNNTDNSNGAGIASQFLSSTLSNLTISNNKSSYSAAGMLIVNGSPSLSNVIFSKNVASANGGGLFVTGASAFPVLTTVSFDANQGANGGGLAITTNAKPNLTNAIFTNNVSTAVGGGIYSSSGANLALTNVTLSHNRAGTYGGGMGLLTASNSALDNVTLNDNTAAIAGAMYLSGGAAANLVMTRFKVEHNSATDYAGAVLMNGGIAPIISDAIFSNNSSLGRGGAIVLSISSPLFSNVTFNNNISTNGSGGALFFDSNSTPTLINVVIRNNSSRYAGGGISSWTNINPTLKHVTFANNTSTETPSKGGFDFFSSTPVLENVLFYASEHAGLTLSALQGNFDAVSDPFINSALPDGADGIPFTADDGMQLRSDATFINQGIDAGVLTDILGRSRINNPEPGAYEYLP